LQPDTAGTAPAFRRERHAERSRWRMADDILVAILGSPMVTADEIEAARNCITDASFKKIEKFLRLKSSDAPFRCDILKLIALYRRRPDPAAWEREGLKEVRNYFPKVLKHLRALQERLPGSGTHDLVQTNFLMAILGQVTKTGRRFDNPRYLGFRTALNDLVEVTEAAGVDLRKKRVPPNLSLEAETWLVRQLAEIFQERTGQHPRDHIQSNYAKHKYRGAFFQMADEVLRCVGHPQDNVTRGRMIVRVLQPRKPPRPV